MRALLIVAVVLPWILIAAGAWFIYQIFAQYGRALLSIDELRARIAALETGAVDETASQPVVAPAQGPAGLPIGTPAPDFALPDLEGRERTLNEFLGEPLLLVFFSPSCGFCVQMSPRLGELGEDDPRVLLITRGDLEENRRLADVHGWKCDVVHEEAWEVANTYQASGTPTGYLIGHDGRIATELMIGSAALLKALESLDVQVGSNGHGGDELTRESLHEREEAVAERAKAAGLAVKDLKESRLKRDGLSAGTPAPGFTLPDLKGARRSLKSFRGKRVLLVFSDTGCGPCEAMSPDLVRIHEQSRADTLEVVMISRGDPAENRAKAEKYGFRFPVLLQRSREVARDYAMFATPVGYLIDENGVIAKDVAVGPEEILKLL